jgi:drug/metabolite transporter (DMT)-like permease
MDARGSVSTDTAAPVAEGSATAGRLRPLLGLLSGTALIAIAPIVVAVSETGPIATGAWRMTIAAATLWAVLLARPADVPRAGPAPRRAGTLLVAALGMSGMLCFWHHGILYSSVANATLFQNMAPVFVALAAWAFWRSQLRAGFLGGLAVAIGGGSLLAQESLGAGSAALRGDLLAMASAACYAVYLIAVNLLRRDGVGTVQLMAWLCLVSAGVMWPVAVQAGETLVPRTPAGWQLILLLALASQVAGQGLIAACLKRLSASFCSAGLLLEPLFAALFAWTLLGERLTLAQAAGGAVVIVGLVLCERTRPERAPRRPTRSGPPSG